MLHYSDAKWWYESIFPTIQIIKGNNPKTLPWKEYIFIKGYINVTKRLVIILKQQNLDIRIQFFLPLVLLLNLFSFVLLHFRLQAPEIEKGKTLCKFS